MKIAIKPNLNVQLCSYGLIASGYDLYDHHDAQIVEVVNRIHDAFSRDTAVKPYFAWARSEQIPVNPYWPKGSGVITASLFVNLSDTSINLSKYLQHERQSSSNMVWKEPDYQQWINQLPEIMALMARMNLHDVETVLQKILQERSVLFQADIQATASILNAFLDDSLSIDEVVYIPNILLATELTDFVHDGNQLYVLATEPRVESMLHELLHHALHDQIVAISETKLALLLTQADQKKLQELGYSWGSSRESNQRIVEESLVRCLTLILESEKDQIREERLQRLRQEGFIVPDNLLSFSRAKPTLKTTRELITAI